MRKKQQIEVKIITKRWSTETMEKAVERTLNAMKNMHPDIKINIEVQDLTTPVGFQCSEGH